jgi:hypothetical protein
VRTAYLKGVPVSILEEVVNAALAAIVVYYPGRKGKV